MRLVDRLRVVLGLRPAPPPAGPRLALERRPPRLALPAPPGPPGAREPADPLCTLCGRRHPALAPPVPAERILTPWSTRPTPLGRGPANDKALIRDRFNPWQSNSPDAPLPDPELAALRGEIRAGPALPDPAPAEAAPGRPPGWRGLRLVDVVRRLGERPPWA